MLSVIEAPEFVQEAQDEQVTTAQPSKPSDKRFRAMLQHTLRALVCRDHICHQPSPETAIDMLARKDPYLYIRAICG